MIFLSDSARRVIESAVISLTGALIAWGVDELKYKLRYRSESPKEKPEPEGEPEYTI
jgi:hypothetical protein